MLQQRWRGGVELDAHVTDAALREQGARRSDAVTRGRVHWGARHTGLQARGAEAKRELARPPPEKRRRKSSRTSIV